MAKAPAILISRTSDLVPHQGILSPDNLGTYTSLDPPDVAPAATTYLLGKTGIIVQSLSALGSGTVRPVSRHQCALCTCLTSLFQV